MALLDRKTNEKNIPHAPTPSPSDDTHSHTHAHPHTHSKKPHAALKMVSGLSCNYNRYFSSGVYTFRYPAVNQHTLAFIDRYMAKRRGDSHILDYGCGDGRYLTALLHHFPKARFTAFDIASAPLKRLEKKLLQLQAIKRVTIIDDNDTLLQSLNMGDKVDIALILFGVFSHIESAKQRQTLLLSLRDSIAATSGKLILSVPNKARRFKREQQQQKSHEIQYTRHIHLQDVMFYYHLYSVKTISDELAQAGLHVIDVRAESIFPESWVTRFSLLGKIDQHLCKILPADWGYGILLCCQAK